MLKLEVGATEAWDEAKQEFVMMDGVTLEFEHSLAALSKWESEWEKPFMSPQPKTNEETIGYIRAMTLTPDVPPELYDRLTDEDITKISAYINQKMTATWFSNSPGATSRAQEVITAEIIYYWLIALNIPFETQYWHLERLLTLVKVCNQKNTPAKKMPRQEWAQRQRQLNAERKARLQTRG
jgi:hypothetical protein